MRRLTLITLLIVCGMFAANPALSTAQQDQSENSRKIANKVPPMYPAVARLMHLQGQVKVEAIVEPNGTVKSVEVKGGHPVLAQAATDAIRKWKWVPAAHETHEPIIVKFDTEGNN
jgi:TonB family protein